MRGRRLQLDIHLQKNTMPHRLSDAQTSQRLQTRTGATAATCSSITFASVVELFLSEVSNFVQALALGSWLRRRYSGPSTPVATEYNSENVVAHSTNYRRTRATMHGVLLGLFPGEPGHRASRKERACLLQTVYLLCPAYSQKSCRSDVEVYRLCMVSWTLLSSRTPRCVLIVVD